MSKKDACRLVNQNQSGGAANPILDIDSSLIRFADEPECRDLIRNLENLRYGSVYSVNEESRLHITDSSDALPGKIGRFHVKSRLGSGSFGAIYKVYDPLYDRTVALKVINPRKVRNIERVLEEARATVRIRDRRIVHSFEVAKDDNGAIYIVLEYVSGGSLRSRLMNGPLNYHLAIEMMESIADAVSVAHSHGLIHRDLKPENILFDGRGNPKVADFGLALSLLDAPLTGEEIAGAPPYMSPEQVEGDLTKVDKRSDIWSLGVIFYEMLTGKLPFSGSRTEIFDQIQNESIVSPGHLNHFVPPRISAICMKCLQKNPAHRYKTASQLGNALHRCLPAVKRQSPKPAPIRQDSWVSESDPGLVVKAFVLGILMGIFITLAVIFLYLSSPSSNLNDLYGI